MPEFNVAHLIQLAVAPVFLIAGVAATLNVLTSRLGRIVDRASIMEAQLEAEIRTHRRLALLDNLRIIARRARYMNHAITLTTFAGFLVAIVVLMLFLHSFFRADLTMVTAVIFVAAVLCLALAMLSFLVEVRIATGALRIGPSKDHSTKDLSK